MNFGKSFDLALLTGRIAYQRQQRIRKRFRRGRVLHQFVDQELTRKDIRKADIGHVKHATHEPPRQGRHLVDDHHRRFEQCRFERRGAAGHQREIRRGEGFVRMPEHQRERQFRRAVAMNRLLKQVPRRAGGRRTYEMHVPERGVKPLGRLHKSIRHVTQLRLSAPGQQCDDQPSLWQAQLFARSGLVHFQRN